jgi:hypothetical protein
MCSLIGATMNIFGEKHLPILFYEACSGSQSVKLAGDDSCLRVCVKVR